MVGPGTKLTRWAAPISVAILLTACGGASAPDDPFRWLEESGNPRVTSWVEGENTKTLGVLQQDPRFAANLNDAQQAGRSPDRLPTPKIIDGEVYNFWQDPDHGRGIWRKTSVADYEAAQPNWVTVLDIDALARDEGKNWVWQGADCSPVTESHCLISLSEGGEDAATIREFDTHTRRFVADGFVLPRGKQLTSWSDDDTVLVSREWQPGELTTSGYPYVVKTWQRGQPLEAAIEVSRGEKTDMRSEPLVAADGDGHRVSLVARSPSFFEHEYSLITATGLRRIALPPKSAPIGLVGNRLLVQLDQQWSTAGTEFPAGSLVSLDAGDLGSDQPRATAVYTPGPQDSLQDVSATRDGVVVTALHDVRAQVTVYHPRPDGTWAAAPVALPDNASVTAGATDAHGALAYLTVDSFLTPPALWRLDTTTARAEVAKSTPPQFDPSPYVVEQQHATSPDGTVVPYFVVHRAGTALDGTTPTILTAYGGFGIAQTPHYEPTLGMLWLRHGGALVLANIRGGGEFGPAWHEAALTTHRQRAYDDFAAVGKDLVARKITSPQRLGITGRSNGGLLMGVEFTQHPELWNAVDIGVPLLDMLRYEQIAAGASWVGEYGSVDVPEQRDFLASISPYEQLKQGTAYPEPFVWTTTKDDRVGPQHARKFAAKLASFGAPYLFYEPSTGGHRGSTNIDDQATITALRYTYFMRKLM
ncbi:prolyl oligopeptidase [Nocardia transvalensis]|uniref:Prolyl oligopeptidase n=1 Tax=Nocardia transvalensis TaxID=37333 RepID=A0A7W9PEG4_9NOCA|nr:prolyl oligopeptidase family serine peptidase [Nocardia transvalensis]MBB5914555.1 prolyl oligopeptidase [Nocardia transvalensis]